MSELSHLVESAAIVLGILLCIVVYALWCAIVRIDNLRRDLDKALYLINDNVINVRDTIKQLHLRDADFRQHVRACLSLTNRAVEQIGDHVKEIDRYFEDQFPRKTASASRLITLK